ncbi:uncharacterized protein LOC142328755 isoform X1 [Lycorma delicatula]|uniref:uncharacterized protein LOC142328755 isoform X1 n=1 Tax=Lycorma delicatula TaxID=130591 RepID=UPI003F519502
MNIFGYFSLIIVLSHLPTFLGSDLFYKRYSRGLKCPSIGIPKARIRLRSRGRAARVSCIQDYQLLGDRYIICEQGEWAEPLPVCIKGGCPWLKTLVPNAEISLSYLGGLANIACLDGYTLSGPSVLICNGFKWNGTIPSCYLNKQSVQKSCDFESAPDDYLCGWKNDVNDNFDWERQSMATPSGFIGTGPEFDHTLGAGLNGHYLYIEATDHNNGDVARLISSHYPPLSENKTNCFTFWYHMYGGHIGSLNVYIGREIVLSESGNHGNRWIKAIIPINSTSPFQIIIEGIRGTGYAGDIAIDDLKLSEGLDCLVGQSNITELTLPGSCSGRCNDNSTTDIDSCYCHEECHLNGTCCADFLQSCGLGLSTSRTKLKTVNPTSTTITLTDLIQNSTFVPKFSVNNLTTSFDSNKSKTTGYLTFVRNSSLDSNILFITTTTPIPFYSSIFKEKLFGKNSSTATNTTLVPQYIFTTVNNFRNISNIGSTSTVSFRAREYNPYNVFTERHKLLATPGDSITTTPVTYYNFTVRPSRTFISREKFNYFNGSNQSNNFSFTHKYVTDILHSISFNKIINVTTIPPTLKTNTDTYKSKLIVPNYNNVKESNLSLITSSTLTNQTEFHTLINQLNISKNDHNVKNDSFYFTTNVIGLSFSSTTVRSGLNIRNFTVINPINNNNYTTMHFNKTGSLLPVFKFIGTATPTIYNTSKNMLINKNISNSFATVLPKILPKITNKMLHVTDDNFNDVKIPLKKMVINPDFKIIPSLNKSSIVSFTKTPGFYDIRLNSVTKKPFLMKTENSTLVLQDNNVDRNYSYVKSVKISSITTKMPNYFTKIFFKNLPVNAVTVKPINSWIVPPYYVVPPLQNPVTTNTKETTVRLRMKNFYEKIQKMNSSYALDKVSKWRLKYINKASQAPYYKEEPNKFRMSTIVVILLSVLTVGAITSIVIYIVRQRKINRNGNCDDDSDVQFLTSDEIINFNWARPSPDRQLYHSPRPERLDCLGLEEK